MGQSESFFKYVIAYFYSKNGILLTMSSKMGLIQILAHRYLKVKPQTSSYASL